MQDMQKVSYNNISTSWKLGSARSGQLPKLQVLYVLITTTVQVISNCWVLQMYVALRTGLAVFELVSTKHQNSQVCQTTRFLHKQ